jgi:SLOG cluster2
VPSDSAYRQQRFPTGTVIGFSISADAADLLARGFANGHLRDLLRRLVRPILREGASVAYAGSWKDFDGNNFTYDLLRLVSAEQEEGNDNAPRGVFYNHVAWPHSRDLKPATEAQWISCCRIVRITQQDAGIAENDVVADAEYDPEDPRAMLNAAITASAMRRKQMQALPIRVPCGDTEIIPPLSARIALGGKLTGYSGFLPGIFEEALATLEANRPLYLLGGFGGATATLAEAMIGDASALDALTPKRLRQQQPRLDALSDAARIYSRPELAEQTEALLARLRALLVKARGDLAGTLRTGLNDADAVTLMRTTDVAYVQQLVMKGLLAAL